MKLVSVLVLALAAGSFAIPGFADSSANSVYAPQLTLQCPQLTSNSDGSKDLSCQVQSTGGGPGPVIQKVVLLDFAGGTEASYPLSDLSTGDVAKTTLHYKPNTYNVGHSFAAEGIANDSIFGNIIAQFYPGITGQNVTSNVLSVTDPAQPPAFSFLEVCSYEAILSSPVAQAALNFPSSGGPGVMATSTQAAALQAPNGCGWIAVTIDGAANVAEFSTGGSTLTTYGPASAAFNVLPNVVVNGSSVSRTYAIDVVPVPPGSYRGRFSFTQDGIACAYSASAFTAPQAGFSSASPGAVTITTSSPICEWQVTAVQGISVIEANKIFTGTGTFHFDVGPNNTGNPRPLQFTLGTALTAQTFQPPIQSNGAFTFTALPPCRIVDTRNISTPEMTAGSTRTFTIAGGCKVPSNAAAYALNVTVVPDKQLGYLAIWPTGQTQPNASTLNSDGRVKANAAIVPAGSGGSVGVFVTDATQVILDITGYFVPSASSPASLAFYPLLPCRIADTRNANGVLGGPYLSGGAAGRSFPILLSTCGIPSSAQAYSLNFTAVPHHALGYLTIWPDGQNQPLVSTLNAPTGVITANAAIVSAGTAGAIDAYATDDTDLVVDVDGYFAPAGSGGLSLYTLAPCRVLDTRNSSGAFIGNLVVNVAGSTCNVPTTAQAYVFNATVVPPNPLGYLTLFPDGQNQPVVSTLNSPDGAIGSNMAIVPTTNGFIDAFASNKTQLILDVTSYFAP